MKTKALVLWVTTILVVVITLPLSAIGSEYFAIPKEKQHRPEGEYLENGVAPQFSYATEKALNAWPGLMPAIEKAKSDFKAQDVGTSIPTEVFKTKSGKMLTIFSGCVPHNCGGNATKIVFDNSISRAYLLVEKPDVFWVYGNPEPEVLRLLVDSFFGP